MTAFSCNGLSRHPKIDGSIALYGLFNGGIYDLGHTTFSPAARLVFGFGLMVI